MNDIRRQKESRKNFKLSKTKIKMKRTDISTIHKDYSEMSDKIKVFGWAKTIRDSKR